MVKPPQKSTKRASVEPKNAEVMIPVERIERTILLIRGEKVILDVDLASLYGVTTKRFNEQIRRNEGRFPATSCSSSRRRSSPS
jgi:ORF6N domain